MVYKIDNLDRKIVELLQEDGRMASAEIARRIGQISERVVRYRIDRMLEKGIINVRAIVDPRALGYRVIGDIFVEIESGHVQEAARQIAQFECVGYVAFSMGTSDISIQVNARSTDELYHFATDVLGKLPWVRKTTTTIVPEKVKDIHNWQIPSSLLKADRQQASAG
ncbi:MAG: Lrp/AsnC family transcriptional regulator [Anaerolineae bacterium]|jgi:Lrp/AsnC family transcriptional regulator for asnA, asnC and gidA